MRRYTRSERHDSRRRASHRRHPGGSTNFAARRTSDSESSRKGETVTTEHAVDPHESLAAEARVLDDLIEKVQVRPDGDTAAVVMPTAF
jgi:hypothetical protein